MSREREVARAQAADYLESEDKVWMLERLGLRIVTAAELARLDAAAAAIDARLALDACRWDERMSRAEYDECRRCGDAWTAAKGAYERLRGAGQ